MRALAVLGIVFLLLVMSGGPGGSLRWVVDGVPTLPAPLEGLLPRSTPASQRTPGSEPTATVEPAGAPTTIPTTANEVVMTEQEVNDRITAAVAAGAPIPVQDLKVRLRGENLVDFTGRAAIAGVTTDLAATVALRSSDGSVTVEVESAQAGPFPVPGGLVSQLVQQALRSLGTTGADASKLPDGIDRVEVRPGALALIRR